MINRFMISVAAAALIVGTGLANAQGTGTPREGGATTQQSAPSERGSPSAAPMNRDTGGASGTTTTPRSGEASKGMNNAQSKEGMSKDRMDSAQSKEGMSKEGMSKDGAKNAQSKEGMSKDRMDSAQSKEGMSKDSMSKDGAKNAQSKDTMSKDGAKNAQTNDSKSGVTTGNAATSAAAAPPAEKRTEIVSAIRSEKIQETTNVNFNISVGATVPASVHFVALPSRIIEIYPEWRGYEVILVSGRYIIVRPRTHEIVYIIEG